MKILFYGFGNIGRNDDGLGPRCIAELQQLLPALPDIEIAFEENFQLSIEDAELISRFDIVFLVDASKADIVSHQLEPVTPTPLPAFTGHAVTPGYLSYLTQDLYRKQPHILLLHIKGYEWEFREGLSIGALENLEKTVSFVQQMLQLVSPRQTGSPDGERLDSFIQRILHRS